MNAAEFKPGNRVTYTAGEVPFTGTVIRASDEYVFVLFDGDRLAENCRPEDLELQGAKP